MRKPRFWIGLGLALVASTGMNPAGVVVRDVKLEPITSCEDLERHIEEVVVREMRSLIEPLMEGRLERKRMRFGCADEALELSGAAPGFEAPNASQGGPAAYTTTNVQVEGVDEPDFVKNDGTRLFVLSGRTLYAQKSWPAHELATVGTLQIEGWPREMLLDGEDRIVVFSDVTPGVPPRPTPTEWSEACWHQSCRRAPEATTKITVVDVSDLSAPTVLREDYLPGQYRNGRRIGSSVRAVLQSQVRIPDGIRLWLDESAKQPGRTDKLVEQEAWKKLLEENERIIRARTLAEWLPQPKRKRADGTLETLPLDCSGFHKPNSLTQLGLLTVATLDLDESGGPIRQDSIIGAVSEVYASQSALYVGNRQWSNGRIAATSLHKFDTTDPSRARYVASGVVDGQIVDQFSLDEFEGHLRVATNLELVSRVFVLKEQGERLEVVGVTEDLAPGETLYSARFMGPRGYLVTAVEIQRQFSDPFFTLDLADPKRPRPVGALDLPGFSTYLHPIDADHVLAIGRDGTNTRTKLSLFDVSDFANPREKFEMPIVDDIDWGTSEAEIDHRAFTWFAEKKLLAIPYAAWGASDLRLFRIDPAVGIERIGRLDMADVFGDWLTQRAFDSFWQPIVRRSVLADDFVYAISDAGVRTARIDALDQPVQTVLFDRSVP